MKIVIELTQKEQYEQFYTMMRIFGERFVNEIYQIIKENNNYLIEENDDVICRIYVENKEVKK